MPPKNPIPSEPSWYGEFDRDQSLRKGCSPDEPIPAKRRRHDDSSSQKQEQSSESINLFTPPPTSLLVTAEIDRSTDARFAVNVRDRFDRYASCATAKTPCSGGYSSQCHQARLIDALYADQDRVACQELPTSTSEKVMKFIDDEGKPSSMTEEHDWRETSLKVAGDASFDAQIELPIEDSRPDASKLSTASGWACSRARTIEDKQEEVHRINSNPNKPIIDALEQLTSSYDITQDHLSNFKVKNLKHVVAQLKKLQTWVGGMTDSDLENTIKGVGKKTLEKIREAEATHTLERLKSINTPQLKAKQIFETVWGIGPKDATWLASQNLYTIDDLRNNRDLLNPTQRTGLDYYEHILQRIPRAEVAEIGATVKSAVERMCPEVVCIVCGSYRRGAATCGDIDVLLTHPTLDSGSVKKVLGRFVREELHSGFLTVTLTGSGDQLDKFMGLCKLPGYSTHRRIDIIAIPYNELPFALLYFTGSAYLNRSMRLKARKMGMSLSQHGLKDGCLWNSKQIKICEGEFVQGLTSEADIFDKLDIPYLEPEERNHG